MTATRRRTVGSFFAFHDPYKATTTTHCRNTKTTHSPRIRAGKPPHPPENSVADNTTAGQLKTQEEEQNTNTRKSKLVPEKKKTKTKEKKNKNWRRRRNNNKTASIEHGGAEG
jgi:hypothetical protein